MNLLEILSIFGLTWAIQNSDLLSRPRNWIMRKSVFAFQLLSCPFCTGFWSGLIIYFLSQKSYQPNILILWGLAGAAISFILAMIIDKLAR